jgi:DNA-directed RNA polymerase
MYIDSVTNHTPALLLKGIVDNQLSVVTVVSDRAIKSSEEAQKIIRALTAAAVQHIMCIVLYGCDLLHGLRFG